MIYYKFLPKLVQNFLEILEDDDYFDITIEVGKDPYVKIFRAHMVILNYRSPYLRRILSTIKRSNDGTLAHIKLPNILPENFQIILRYIYGGELSLEEYDILDIIKILKSSNELGLQELTSYLQTYLIEHKDDWIEQNFNFINRTSFEHDSFSKLQKFCTELMYKEPEKLFKSLDFVSMPEKSLISLIRDDNLKMDEVQVWDHVLKWGIAQNPELSSNPSRYSNDDFNVLKDTLQHCIPFIRFYNLTPKEFLDKVFQYRKILPEKLYEDLIKYFLDPNSKPDDLREPRGTKKISVTNTDSTIILDKHVELISKWIDELDMSKKSSTLFTLYEFKLILRGSRDGFSSKKFYEICNNQIRTVVIIKVKNHNEILGGYNPVEWKSNNTYGTTKDSFIFSFKDKYRIENHILSRVKNEERAIYNNINYGPSFGCGDLFLFGSVFYRSSYCYRHDYEKHIRDTNDYFSVEDYEVFQVISK